MCSCLCYFILVYSNVSLANYSFRYVITDPSTNITGPNAFAYLDIGHAEDWRDYWSYLNKSLILGPTQWPGEYYVKFWDPRWLNIMEKEIRGIAERGYGGVFFDNLDACLDLNNVTSNACTLMEDFVNELSSYASSLGLKVIVNVGSVAYMAPELKVYGVLREETLCPLDPQDWSDLVKAKEEGKVVIDVEYNTTNACESVALKACDEGIYVYLAPSVSLSKPSDLCKRSQELGYWPLLAVFAIPVLRKKLCTSCHSH
ncbi:hypothetical protein IPA_08890 [Ignicoccus pacificus DSM 13166]|uniref:Glycoside-hydrolase family GH114 TIM-barrel domain-containing protein n=1 Tax=Ignicoccus pacificus DSM 13166 TaxID=940294 RepID=A0A977KBZ5_9CREN|nr:hypothetical protein IPA_08890 [Ignicoccus pacificus DSM 13166]